MHQLKDRIFINEWLNLKPYERQVPTDSYYLELSNRVKQALISSHQSFVLSLYIDREGIDILACFLTSYFEDIISGTNLWRTFTRTHKELYQKPLPFYEWEDYYEDEINVQDVYFLIWYFVNTYQQEKFIAPVNGFIFEMAEKVMAVFDEAWEYAPENEDLKRFYTIDENETDFYHARNLIDNILFKSYLFYTDTLAELLGSELEIIEEYGKENHVLSLLNENRDQLLHKVNTRLLALSGKEWAARLIGKYHPLYNDFLNMTPKISGHFMYKGQDEKDVFIEHIASGKKFAMTKKSFEHCNEFTEKDTIVFIGIVNWRNEWWFSGVVAQRDFDPDLILDEKNSLEKRKVVDFLDHKEHNPDGILEKQLEVFKDLTNGSQIAFLKSDEIEDFVKKFIAHYNKVLKLSKREREKARKRAEAEGFFGGEETTTDFSDAGGSGVVFFNPKGGVEAAFDVNSAFPSPLNPFYDEDESTEHLLHLFMSDEISTELAKYCVDNYKSELPFFEEEEGKMYLKNIDFLLRFWKKENFFTKPAITFTGTPK
ncbi:DUF3843 family protein [Anaerophaga thermohalophila]|uniref:DUF3843 family protein n=1 Tax=Anaerophaga thermohalophila TaxID=177400 RepID=UPI0003196F67|nr:DUF3843 family protein [Anaerophaga thermohalophila]